MGSKELSIKYTGDASGVLAAQRQIESAVVGLGDKLRSAGQKMASVGTSLTKGLTLPIVGFGIAATKAFAEAEKVMAQTEAVLESTGGAANVTAKQVEGLATQIQNYSGMSGEAVQAGENMLLTFTNIRNAAGKGNDVFNQTTAIMADMSVALGQDATTSALQLGKALNDPIRGVTALQRVGVSFTDAQREQITAMVEAGDVMGAQKLILAELTTEFGGSARAIGETAAGQWNIAKEKIGDAMESIGAVIVEVLVPAFEKVVGWLQTALNWFNQLDPGMKSIVVTLAAVAAAVGPVLVVVGKLVSAFGLVINAVRAVTLALAANPYLLLIAATVALVALIIANWDKVKEFLIRTWERIKEVAKFIWDNIAPFIIGPIKFAIDWLIEHWRGVVTFLRGIWIGIRETAQAVWDAIKTVIINPIVAVKERLAEVWDGIREAVATAWNFIKEKVGAVVGAVIRFVERMISKIQDAITWLRDLVDLTNLSVRNLGDASDAIGRQIGAKVPGLAHGGIVRSPTLALVGEAGPEAVIPLPRGGGFGGGITWTGDVIVQGSVHDQQDLARTIRDEFVRLQRRNVTTGVV